MGFHGPFASFLCLPDLSEHEFVIISKEPNKSPREVRH